MVWKKLLGDSTPINVLVLGIEGSGKSTLVQALQDGDREEHKPSPTIGVQLSDLKLGGRMFHFREVGGCMVPVWKHYFQYCNRLVYVLDATKAAPCSILSAATELIALLQEPTLRDIPFCIVFSKADETEKYQVVEVDAILSLYEISRADSKEVSLLEVSAFTERGLSHLRDWLMKPQHLQGC